MNKNPSNQIPFFLEPVAAGFPSPATDFIEKKLDLNEKLIKHPVATFFVRVSGHSMKGSGILDGSMLIVDRSLKAKNNNIIIAVLNGEFTIKRIQISTDQIQLISSNSRFKPIRVTKDADFEIWGVVTCVINEL